MKASSLKRSDCLFTVDGHDKIVSVSYKKGRGIYTLVTKNDFLVVGGVGNNNGVACVALAAIALKVDFLLLLFLLLYFLAKFDCFLFFSVKDFFIGTGIFSWHLSLYYFNLASKWTFFGLTLSETVFFWISVF